MPSMDFAYDLIEKLSEESDTDYAIVILRKGRKQDKLDFFYRFEKENKDTLRVLSNYPEIGISTSFLSTLIGILDVLNPILTFISLSFAIILAVAGQTTIRSLSLDKFIFQFLSILSNQELFRRLHQ